MGAGRRETWRTRALRRVLAPLVAFALRALGATWRFEDMGRSPFATSPPAPILAALWHEDILVSVVAFRDRGARTSVSRSRDGENIAAVLRYLGFGEAIRGSSSRGASSSLRGLVRVVREGGEVSVLVDGPRGPARVAKVGVVAAARLSGQPILPVVLVARPCLRFRSWDRTQLPLPFARIVVGWGECIPVPADTSDEEQAGIARALDLAMSRLREAAEARLSIPPGGNPSN
jgi:lysophospholipid acyltransferase (LPLAT)-like uncharacterized protein